MVANVSPALAVDEARQAYDKMVEEATREADAYLQEKEARQQAAEETSRERMDAALQARTEAERQRLLNEMDAVRRRGLGPNFTQGMKEYRLGELQQHLDRLANDPEAYFNNP